MTDLPPVVDTDWYRANAADVVLVDVRWYSDGRDGHRAYQERHIPGAVWVSIDHDLSSSAQPGAGGRHPIPTPDHLAAALGRRGIGGDDTVVAYDDVSGSAASRLVWLLRVIGQRAAILDGGLGAWRGLLESGSVERPAVERATAAWPADRFTTPHAVRDGTGHDVLVDARPHDRYTGEARSALDPRQGHIPGAVNVPWAANFNDDGTFASPDGLRQLYAARGISADSSVVAYCGSGITACTDLIALERAGVSDTRLYPGSWSEWATQPGRPVETGDRRRHP